MFKAAKVAWKAIGLGRRLVEGYSRLKAARRALEEIVRRGEELKNAATAARKAAIDTARREAAQAAARAKAQAQAARAKARQEAAQPKAAKARAQQQAAERQKIANRRPEGCSLAADVAADRPDAARPVARQVTATTGHAVWTLDRGWVTAGVVEVLRSAAGGSTRRQVGGLSRSGYPFVLVRTRNPWIEKAR